MSGTRGSSSRMHDTPLDSSVAKPRKLWPTSEPQGHVRLEIGGSALGSTRKSLEGINSMMHQSRHAPRDATPSSRGSNYPSGQPPHHHPAGPPPYRGDMATPIKSSMGHHLHHQRPTPSSGRHHLYPPGSGSKHGYPSSAQKGEYPGSTSKPHYSAPQDTSISAPSGKENKKKSPSAKRSPCNCKKSKCLKLYCECFAAERFCQGCNCADCGNTPTAGLIREKAIKDTRAKNPNAFKPRIGHKHVSNSPQTGHNMGCKCKRSECLKKYCEVSNLEG